MLARDIMTKRVVSVRPDATLEEAIDIMLARRISGLPVTDPAGRLAGMLTEGDLLRRSEIGTARRRPRWLQVLASPGRLAEEYTHERGRRVEDVMTRHVRTVTEETPVEEIVDLMAKHGVKRVPVFYHGGVVGIVTRADILRGLARTLHAEAAGPALDDAGIAAAIRTAFQRSQCIPANMIDVAVQGGEVSLSGSILDERERTAIRVAIEGVPGVKAVHDHLVWIEPMSGLVFLSPEDEAAEKAQPAAAA